jgi:hypothetical protein
LVGPRVGLGSTQKSRITCPSWESNSDSSTDQPVSQSLYQLCYPDCWGEEAICDYWGEPKPCDVQFRTKIAWAPWYMQPPNWAVLLFYMRGGPWFESWSAGRLFCLRCIVVSSPPPENGVTGHKLSTPHPFQFIIHRYSHHPTLHTLSC